MAGQTSAFVRAARCYWFEIFPQVRHEIRHWRSRAEEIPDAALRRDALYTHRTKSRHSEGLAAYAVLVPAEFRRDFIRAAVAYQLVLDYLDTVSEHPINNSIPNCLQLHRAFAVAVDLEARSEDYYALQAHGDDGGYLAEQVAACREALKALPSYAIAVGVLRKYAEFGAQAQAFHHAIPLGLEEETVATWAREATATTESDREIKWWEVVAAACSSVPMGAMMATAADPASSPEDVALVDATYFPWGGAFNTLLDCLVDIGSEEFAANHLNRYASREEAREHLVGLAVRTRQLSSGLSKSGLHEMVLAGVGGYYLAQPQAWLPGWERSAQEVLDALGAYARPALGVHCLRQGRPRTALRVFSRQNSPQRQHPATVSLRSS